MTENQKTAEKYLLKIRKQSKRLKSLLNEIEALEYAAAGQGTISYEKDRVQKSTDRNIKLVEFMDDIINKKNEFDEVEAELDELKITSYHIIKKIENIDERIILEWYYINAKSMEEIIKKISVSERKAYYLREEALESFGTIFMS